jgi:hypothetical protein
MEENPEAAQGPEEMARGEDDSPAHGAAPEAVSREKIAERAFLISQSDEAGTDEENWLRAERELREEQEQQQG